VSFLSIKLPPAANQKQDEEHQCEIGGEECKAVISGDECERDEDQGLHEGRY
jgi:hypothetical protein